MTILAVDDSRPFLNALAAILNDAGYRDVVKKDSATEAIDYLQAAAHEGDVSAVDIILMDIMMPEMDGIEAVRIIKSHQTLADISIIMVSGQEPEAIIEQAFEAGAIDYIKKPLKKLELQARVRSALKLKQEIDRRKKQQEELERLNRTLEAANRELGRLSTIDALTGIANRRYFNEIIAREWLRAIRTKKALSVIFIDIDYFKRFNDCYGHLEGDLCLIQVASRLKGVLRRPGDLLARYGGEEFVALLPNTEEEGGRQIARVMRRCIVDLKIEHVDSPVDSVVTVSIGVASFIPQKGSNPSDLIELADKALYKAKKSGRSRVEVQSFLGEDSREGPCFSSSASLRIPEQSQIKE